MKIMSAVEYDTPKLIKFGISWYIYDPAKKYFVRGTMHSSYNSEDFETKFTVVTAKLSDCELIFIVSTEWLGYAAVKAIHGKLDSYWESSAPIKHFEIDSGIADLDRIRLRLDENFGATQISGFETLVIKSQSNTKLHHVRKIASFIYPGGSGVILTESLDLSTDEVCFNIIPDCGYRLVDGEHALVFN